MKGWVEGIDKKAQRNINDKEEEREREEENGKKGRKDMGRMDDRSKIGDK